MNTAQENEFIERISGFTSDISELIDSSGLSLGDVAAVLLAAAVGLLNDMPEGSRQNAARELKTALSDAIQQTIGDGRTH